MKQPPKIPFEKEKEQLENKISLKRCSYKGYLTKADLDGSIQLNFNGCEEAFQARKDWVEHCKNAHPKYYEFELGETLESHPITEGK